MLSQHRARIRCAVPRGVPLACDKLEESLGYEVVYNTNKTQGSSPRLKTPNPKKEFWGKEWMARQRPRTVSGTRGNLVYSYSIPASELAKFGNNKKVLSRMRQAERHAYSGSANGHLKRANTARENRRRRNHLLPNSQMGERPKDPFPMFPDSPLRQASSRVRSKPPANRRPQTHDPRGRRPQNTARPNTTRSIGGASSRPTTTNSATTLPTEENVTSSSSVAAAFQHLWGPVRFTSQPQPESPEPEEEEEDEFEPMANTYLENAKREAAEKLAENPIFMFRPRPPTERDSDSDVDLDGDGYVYDPAPELTVMTPPPS